MKKYKQFFTKALAVVAMSAFVFTGCGNVADNSENNAQQTETVVVTDARGEVEIPANPQRIVDISGNSDMLSILGYDVVGTANSDAYDYTKLPTYLEDTLKDATILGYSMQDTMDVEGIIALNPDLIIISSVQEKMYDQLSEIAPTVMIQLEQIDWKKDLEKVASIFGKEAEAQAWLKNYEEVAAETGKTVKNTYGEDTTYLALLASGGQIFIFDKAGIGSVLYDDMGLARPEGLPEQENISLPVVDYEGLASIDADYIFAVGTDEDLATLTENTIWKNIPAVKEGDVLVLPASPYFNIGYSTIGRLEFVNEVPTLLGSLNE